MNVLGELRRYNTLSSYEVLHFFLRSLLEKHENKDNKGERAQLTELRMYVARDALKRERNLFDYSTRKVNEGSYKSKL